MRILVVEDEPDLRSGLARALRDEDYAVDLAEDGQEALEKALLTDYDALILDIMLPEMDGWAVLQRLRARKQTPVLMLTAKDAVRDRVRGLDAGADDYLTKPFHLSELLARLRAMIRRQIGQSATRLDVAGRIVDTAAKKVFWEGKEVGLTAFEYILVEYLALHQGKVITRTQLYEHLFDENSSTLSNLMNVHISNIRKKLGQDFIQTRRGHGYSIA